MDKKIKSRKAGRHEIVAPETLAEKIRGKVPPYIKLCFASSVILGLVIHMYMLTNKLPNHDDIGHLFGSDYGTASGRWLLPGVLGLDGDLSMPWLIGVISVLLLALSACLIAAVMRIRTPVSVVVLSALVVSFPAVASTFVYMFSADAYFLSFALACLSAFLTDRYRFGFIGGAAVLVLSLGIYQGYLGVSAFLMLGALILYVLEGKMPLKEVWLRALKSAAVLALGVVGYMLIVKLSTLNEPLVDYMGIADMGKLSLSEIPALVKRAYLSYPHFFLWNSMGAHFGFLKYAFWLTAAATVFLIAVTGIRGKLNWQRWLVLVFFIIIYPLAGNLIYLMTPDASPHMLMLYGLVGMLTAPLSAVNAYNDEGKRSSFGQAQISSLCCWVITISLALTSYSYALFSNEVYLKLQLTYEQTFAYSVRLVNAIETSEYYSEDSIVMLIAVEPGQAAHNPTPELDSIQITGTANMQELINSYTYGRYLNRYAGLKNEVYDTQHEYSMDFAKRDEVLALSCYPSEGCITRLDGYIVVRLS